MNILLVDDSKTMRNIQKKTLEAMGPATFAEASDGVEAWNILAGGKNTFDLVLVDWNMPNMDGLTLVTKFRAVNRSTPVIMVTTEAEKSRVLEALKAGVNNYVVKPFTPEVLVEKVKQTLAKRAA